MMDGIDLGDAVLDLTVDQSEADRELDRFEARLIAQATTMDSVTKAMGLKSRENLRLAGEGFTKEVAEPASAASLAVRKATSDIEQDTARADRVIAGSAATRAAAAAQEGRALEALTALERRYRESLDELRRSRESLDSAEADSARADEAYQALRGNLTKKGLAEANERMAALRDEREARRDMLRNAADEVRATEIAIGHARKLREEAVTGEESDADMQRVIARRISTFSDEVKRIAAGEAAMVDLTVVEALRRREAQAAQAILDARQEAIHSAGGVVYERLGGEGMMGSPSIRNMPHYGESTVAGVKGPGGGGRSNPVTVVLEAGQRAGMSPTESAAGTFMGASSAAPVTGPDSRSGVGVGGEVDLSDRSLERMRDYMQDAMTASLAEVMPNIAEELRKSVVPGAASVERGFVMEPGQHQAHALYEVGPNGRIPVGESNDPMALAALARQRELGWTENRARDARGRFITNQAIRAKAAEEAAAIEDEFVPLPVSHVPGFGPRRFVPGGLTAEEQLAAMAMMGGGGRGGGGGWTPDLLAALWGHGGGGGGGGRGFGWGPLGWALGGALGLGAGIGSIGSLAGFGGEHVLTTIGSVVGSGMSAAAGAGLVASGALGQMLVGGGSDLAVVKSTITDTQALGKAYDNVQKAVKEYGANSVQAKEAQHALNVEMEELGNTAGVKAELGLAKAGEKLNELFNLKTSGARVQATKIGLQGTGLGEAYVPMIGRAAEQNLAIINSHLRPLFAWLEGPEGMGVFNTLEMNFQKNLPTAVHAFDQGVEFLLKTMREASGYTGGLTTRLDEFFTRINSPSGFASWRDEMGRLIDTTRLWEHFLKLVGSDIYGIFRNDAQTGSGIIATLDTMLEKAHEWEYSTRGEGELKSIFLVHKEEVIELLKLLDPMASSFTHIYLQLAPPLVKVVTRIAEAIGAVVHGIEELGPVGKDVLGGAFVAWKLGLLGPALKGIRSQVKGLTGDLLGQAAADETLAREAGAATLAQAGEATAGVGRVILPAGVAGSAAGAVEEAGVLGGLGSFIKGGGLAKAGLLGIAGSMGGELLANAIGATGTAKSALTFGGAGAGIGAAVAPLMGIAGPWGIAAGAALGLAAPVLGHLIGDALIQHVNQHAGENFAAGVLAPGRGMLTRRSEQEYEQRLENDRKATLHGRERYAEDFERTRNGGLRSTPQQRTQDFNSMFHAEYREGVQTAGVAIGQYAGVSKKTVESFTLDVLAPLRQLSGESRKAAATAMIDYASELEHKGQLGKGATHKVLLEIEQQFPGLVDYFRSHAAGAAEAVAQQMKLERAKQNLGNSLRQIRAEWGLFNVDPNVTGAKWVQNTGTAMADLRKIISSTTGKTKEEAEKHLRELQHSTDSTMKALAHSTDANMAHLAAAVKGHIPGAVQKVEGEFHSFESTVISAMESGAIATGKGSELIAQALNKEIVALGGKPLPEISVKVAGGVAGAVAGVGKALKFASGGLTQIGEPGTAGHDNVPLNVGGQQIVVGEGEQVAVFNRHQIPFVNAGLMMQGFSGLEGLFSTVTTPNYMASGGMLGKMVAEANHINAQHYPYLWGGGHGNFLGPYDCSGSVSAVLHAGGVLSRPEVSGELMTIGQPGPGRVTIYANPQHTFMSIDGHFFGTHGADGAGWYPGSALPGFAVRHIPISPGESYGSIPMPKVSGKGMMAADVKTGLGKLVKQANKYLASHSFGSAIGGAPGGAHAAFGKSALEHLWVQAGGDPHEAKLMAALALAESGGNPQAYSSFNDNGSHAQGLWQIEMPMHAAQVPGGNAYNPIDNARGAVAIRRSQGLGAWETYTNGAYRKFMASGGMLFAKGGRPSAMVSSFKRAHPKGGQKVRTPSKPAHLSVGSLAMNMNKIKGMAHSGHVLAVDTDAYNALNSEFSILGEMATNPASLMAEDMSYLAPAMKASGVKLEAGMLVPYAERIISRAQLSQGETEPLSELASLLSWIGSLDTHRLISTGDEGLLGVPGYLHFSAGESVFGSELALLKALKHAEEKVGHMEKVQVTLAQRFIARRIVRREKLKTLAKRAAARLHKMKRRLEIAKLNAAEQTYAREEARKEGAVHLAEIRQTIAEERGLPKYEQNQTLINALETQAASISAHDARLARASSLPVILAESKLQMKPLEEQLHHLSGNSTMVGKAGEIGEVEKQIKALQGGARELATKEIETRTSGIPKLSLQISQLQEQIAESKEAVRPKPVGSGEASDTGKEEKEQITKEELQQAQLRNAILEKQYGVLSRLPAVGGSFAVGGVVPGIPGTPKLIEAHAGETILKQGEGGGNVTVVIEDGAVDQSKIKVIANGEAQKVVRKVGKGTNRPLPSRGN